MKYKESLKVMITPFMLIFPFLVFPLVLLAHVAHTESSSLYLLLSCVGFLLLFALFLWERKIAHKHGWEKVWMIEGPIVLILMIVYFIII
jgi:glucan phosphoethanolaminetransferase (alkaline phosphatase superfamily)